MTQARPAVTLLLVIMLLMAATSTATAGPPVVTQTVVDAPVSFSLPAGTCEAAWGGLDGSGQIHTVTITRQNSDGSQVITANALAKGTAWDADGGSYTFVYQNHSVESIPAGGGAHAISMEDSFVLNGTGAASPMNVGFRWNWTYTPPADLWPPNDNWQRITERGDPLHCDPL